MIKRLSAFISTLTLLALPTVTWAVQADLSWTNPSGATVRVERRDGDDAQPWVAQGTPLPAGATTFSQTGLALNVRYCYRPVAFNEFGDAQPPWPFACSSGNTPENVGGVILIIRP